MQHRFDDPLCRGRQADTWGPFTTATYVRIFASLRHTRKATSNTPYVFAFHRHVHDGGDLQILRSHHIPYRASDSATRAGKFQLRRPIPNNVAHRWWRVQTTRRRTRVLCFDFFHSLAQSGSSKCRLIGDCAMYVRARLRVSQAYSPRYSPRPLEPFVAFTGYAVTCAIATTGTFTHLTSSPIGRSVRALGASPHSRGLPHFLRRSLLTFSVGLITYRLPQKATTMTAKTVITDHTCSNGAP